MQYTLFIKFSQIKKIRKQKSYLVYNDNLIHQIPFCIVHLALDHMLNHRQQYMYQYELVAVVVAYDDNVLVVNLLALLMVQFQQQRIQFQ